MQQRNEFLGEPDASVMLLLPRDVCRHRRLRRMTHAERAVTRLPRKAGVGAAMFAVQPESGIRLQQSRQFGESQDGWTSHEQVDVVGGAVDGQSGRTGLARDAAQVSEHVGTQGVI